MNRITRTVQIPKHELDFARAALATKGFVPDSGRDEVMLKYTFDFGNGIEADIKLCNGDSPFIDPVLFENGDEVLVLGVRDELTGMYEFSDPQASTVYAAILEPAARA